MAGLLEGKVAFISGTGRHGIGRMAAMVFAAEGAKVFGCAQHKETSDATVNMVREAGGVMEALAPADLSTPEGAKAWIEAGVDTFGGIDILFNNAGTLRHGRIDEIPLEDWYLTIDNELHLPFLCTRAAWPHLRKRGGGLVINMGSVAGHRGVMFQTMIPHGVTKGAMISFTRHLASEGRHDKIRAVSISPGILRSESTQHYFDDPAGPIAELMKVTPSNRAGEAVEVANLAAFLASDKATYINGADIAIDGGVSAIGG